MLGVIGMHGLGDNLHQRAIVRQLMAKYTVHLETPWPCVYHDLVGDRLRLARKPTVLRTQAKNLQRELDRYHLPGLQRGARSIRVWYSGDDVRKHGSIFAAMLANTGCSLATADFRLPIPAAWYVPVDVLIAKWRPTKPILLYRPLVERTEWKGCAGRNPDFQAYAEIFSAIREAFFVVSVADLVPGKEWLVGHPADADVRLHAGELPFESLAALASRASLVYCSAGFAPLLAQAVGTPVVCVFGGHESSMTIKDGAKFAPTLGIDPIEPCNCFDHNHAHRKAINIPRAVARTLTFIEENVRADSAQGAPVSTRSAYHRLVIAPQAVHESGGVGGAVRPDRERVAQDGD